MPQNQLPKISENQVRQLATAQSFARGRDYYQQNQIKNPILQNDQLQADCYGSKIYRVKITLKQNGLESCQCTCPYDWGGICKHQVALLLAYIKEPESFHHRPSLDEMLADYSRQDLINLIGRMTQRYPDLVSYVELSIPSKSPQKAIDLTIYQRQIERALEGEECEDIVEDLQILLDIADELFDNQDYLNAGNLYELLLKQMNESYDDILFQIDYDGEICCFSQEFVTGLGKCLQLGTDTLASTVQQSWIFTLLDTFFKELELGGIDYGSEAEEYVLKHANNEQWQEIEEQIIDKIHETNSNWCQETLVNLLASRRREQKGNSEATNDLIYRFGTPQQQAFLLLEEDKIEQAVTIARQHFMTSRGSLQEFADALLSMNAHETALKLILEANEKTKFWGYQEWLSKYYQQHGDTKIALDWQEKIFWNSSTLENYQRLEKLAQQMKNWAKLREQILLTLKQKKLWVALIDIALYEQNFERAIELLDHLNNWHRPDYLFKVATATADIQPESSIALYQELVELAIAQKQRKSYRVAVGYLAKIQNIYLKLKQKSQWQGYLQNLQTRYSNLRALQDEISKGSL